MSRKGILGPVLTSIATAIYIILLTSAAVALCPRVKPVVLSDKRAEIEWWLPGPTGEAIDERDVEEEYGIAFGGYRVWVKEVWKGGGFNLLREYIWGESDTSAAGYWDPDYLPPFYVDTLRYYVNRSVQNGFPYEFSVTAFFAGVDSVNQACLQSNTTGVVYPTEGPPNNLATIQVIPNPYRSSADWEYGGQNRVLFVGLPVQGTIRIYTTAGTLVRTIEHHRTGSDQDEWDLRNEDGEEVAPGVYIWDIETESGAGASGKMMIIK